MTRLGMADLIQKVRINGQAETSEFTIGGDTYWTDEHLESVLDEHRTDNYSELLQSVAVYNSDNEAEYYDYYWQHGNVEQANSGSAVWLVQDSVGSAIGTATYTVNYPARHIRFTANTEGSAYYLSYRHYNVELATADVWETRASTVAQKFDVSTDNHSLKRSQLFDHYMKMAALWRKKSLAVNGGASGFNVLVRSDVNYE